MPQQAEAASTSQVHFVDVETPLRSPGAQSPKGDPGGFCTMSVLTREAIWQAMKEPNDPLVVTPLLEEAQVADASIDVRLGHEFIVLRQARMHHVDPTEGPDDWRTMLYR